MPPRSKQSTSADRKKAEDAAKKSSKTKVASKPAKKVEDPDSQLDALLDAVRDNAEDDSEESHHRYEEFWLEAGENGYYCGLTRDGSDGPIAIRAEPSDSVDMVMRRLAKLYSFGIAEDPDAIEVPYGCPGDEVDLSGILMEDEHRGEDGVYRLTLAVQCPE